MEVGFGGLTEFGDDLDYPEGPFPEHKHSNIQNILIERLKNFSGKALEKITASKFQKYQKINRFFQSTKKRFLLSIDLVCLFVCLWTTIFNILDRSSSFYYASTDASRINCMSNQITVDRNFESTFAPSSSALCNVWFFQTAFPSNI